MAYSRKDVTECIQKNKKKKIQGDELIDKIDKAIDELNTIVVKEEDSKFNDLI